MKIAVNSVIQYDDESIERVLWIGDDRKDCAVVVLNDIPQLPSVRNVDEIERALDEGSAVKRTVDPHSLSTLSEKFKAKHKHKRDAAWDRISDIVVLEPEIFDAKRRNELITATADKLQCSKSTLYRDIKRYWQRGKTKNALFPDYFQSGAPGKERLITEEKQADNPQVGYRKRGRKREDGTQGINITEETLTLLKKGYLEFYASRKVNTLKKAYRETMRKYFNIGTKMQSGVEVPILPDESELPSFTQFKYWGTKGVDRKRVVRQRSGSREFPLQYRAKTGTSTTMAKGPGHIYQMDATYAPFYLVHRITRHKINGKPTVYFSVDLFSRRCVGFHVCMHKPSWDQARMLLFNTFTDKVAFCKRYNVDIKNVDWDVSLVPKQIDTDRGEFASNPMGDVADALGFSHSLVAPYRGDFKAVVEYKMHQFLLKYQDHPGAVRKGQRERGDEMPGIHAALDINQFVEILIQIILTYNQTHVMDTYDMDPDMLVDLGPESTPDKIWAWGVSHRGSYFHERPLLDIQMALLRQEDVAVNRNGISYKGFYYTSPTANRDGWFEKDPLQRKTRKFRIAIGETTDQVWVVLRRGEFEKCVLTEKYRAFQGWTWEEVKEYGIEQKKRQAPSRNRENQSQSSLDARIDSIVQKAREQTERALEEYPQTKTARHRGIKTNNQQAKVEETTEQQEILSPQVPSHKTTVMLPERHVNANQRKKKKILDMLKGLEG